jgi:hypothetical protein
MDEESVKELIAMYHNGEIDPMELMVELDNGRFDGDLFDYL